jgi:2-hydroxy-6-oxonona-2,4-dienedioate hydrolase
MTAWLDMLGGEVKFVDIRGVRTRSLEAGSGPPLLFLHARAAHAETWIKNVVPLAAHFHTYAIDLLGHGLTECGDSACTIGDQAEHAIGFLEAVGASSAFVCGQATGGQLGVWMAIQRPELVRALVWAAPAGLGGGDNPPEGRNRSVDTARSTAINDPSLENVQKRMELLFADPSRLDDEAAQLRSALYSRPDVAENLRKTSQADNSKYGLTEEVLARVQAPVLAIGTEGGRAEIAERVAQAVPNGTYQLMSGCRTWPQYEQADAFNRLVTDFLVALPG